MCQTEKRGHFNLGKGQKNRTFLKFFNKNFLTPKVYRISADKNRMEKVVYSRILVATQLLLFVLGLSGLSACRLGEASLSGNLTSIYGSDPDQNSNTETLVVETASGGSGTAIDTLNLVVGESTEFFSVMRKSSGEFVADAEVSWVLNGGIGTLTIDPSGQSAQFNAIAVGTGQVKAYTGGLSFIVDLNVTLPPLPTISFTSSAQSVTEGSDIVNGPEWYAGPGYTHRVRLTFDNSAQSENLNDFPVMVKLVKAPCPGYFVWMPTQPR